jgi:hypothetical protein
MTVCRNIYSLRIKALFSLLTAISIIHCVPLKAQDSLRKAVGMAVFSSGNGHGMFFSPYFLVEKERHAFTAGPLISKRYFMMNGAKLTHSYNFTASRGGYRERVQLNWHSYLHYNGALPLKYSTVVYEQSARRFAETDINSVRLSTGEIGTGFLVQWNFGSRLSWLSYACASVYHHFRYTSLKLDHERTGPGLALGTSLVAFF